MVLSYCSDFGYVYPPQTQTEIAAELFDSFAFSESFVNPLYEFEDELFYSSDSYTNLLPYFSSSPSDDAISLSPDIFPVQELEDSYHHYYPKRQKSYGGNFQSSSSSFNPSLFDGYVSNFDQVLLPEFLQEIPAPVVPPKFAFPEPAASTFSEGRTNNYYNESSSVMKKPSVTAQSIAARERRRKITDKTQELGKLIPGGNKMNTAEMLQSAFKYVKFLQAQVRVLENMESIKEIRNEDLHKHDDELQILLTSPRIQEKLYSQEKCLVPREFLQTKANDQEIQSTPSIIDEIYQSLLGTN